MPATDHPCHLDLLFADGTVTLRDATNDRDLRASWRDLGPVALRGLLIGDPFSGSMVPVHWPGEGSVPATAVARVLVVDAAEEGDRVSALALLFEPSARITRWERCDATMETDCAIGGFASAALKPAIDDEEHDHALLERYEAADGWCGTVLTVDEQSVALSSTGYGDGAYDAWWGVTDDGTPAALAIDFDVLSEGVFEEARVPLPLPRGATRVAQLPHVHLNAGWFRRQRPQIVTSQLPDGHSVYTRVVDRSGKLRAPEVTHGTAGFTIDLRPFDEPQALLIRMVTGYAPMEIVGRD
jgi:hypothetical protein